MLSKFSDIEICRGGVRTNRGPWAGGPRRAGRRDGSVARLRIYQYTPHSGL